MKIAVSVSSTSVPLLISVPSDIFKSAMGLLHHAEAEGGDKVFSG